MKKTTREKLVLFNEWMAQAPHIKVESEDIASIVETDPMSWEELKFIRDNLEYFQSEFSVVLGVSLSTYQKWERDPEGDGTVNIPLPMAKKVRMYYNLPALTFLSLEKLQKGIT